MAEELPAGTAEVDSPLLVADMLRLLNVKGAIGRLQLADIVIPIISLGDVVQPTVAIRSPSFRSTDVFSAGILAGPAAGTIMADTGALEAGTYDVQILYSGAETTNRTATVVEHRNAANTATLMTFSIIQDVNANRGFTIAYMAFGYELSVNERLRVIVDRSATLGEERSATIFARTRA